jgi:hypothetical protein
MDDIETMESERRRIENDLSRELSDEEIFRVATQMDNPRKKHIDKANKELGERFPHIKGLPKIGHHMIFDSKTNSGKSSAAKSMIMKYYRGLYHRVVVFATTIDYEDWDKVFKLKEEDMIKDVTQERLISEIDKSIKRFLNADNAHGPEKYNYFTLFVIDDLAGRLHGWKSFTDRLTMARHAGISFWVLSQDPMFIDPAQRANMWAYSIGPQYENMEDLKRLAKGKSLTVSRSASTSAKGVPLAEGLATIRKINDDLGEQFGRLFITTVDEGGVYRQNAHILEPFDLSEMVEVKEIPGEKKITKGKSLSKMTKVELLDLLASKKIKVPSTRMTKVELIALLSTQESEASAQSPQ